MPLYAISRSSGPSHLRHHDYVGLIEPPLPLKFELEILQIKYKCLGQENWNCHRVKSRLSLQNASTLQSLSMRKGGNVGIRAAKWLIMCRQINYENATMRGWDDELVLKNCRILFLSRAFTSPPKRTQVASSSRSVDGKRQTERGKRPILSNMKRGNEGDGVGLTITGYHHCKCL